MGLRGRHRDGYHVSLLYSLELFYQLEGQHKARMVSWRGLPRKRPRHYLAWLNYCADVLTWPARSSLGDLLRQLEDHQLATVAQVLDYALQRYLVDDEVSESTALADLVAEPVATQELFPQARKLGQQIRDHVDGLWLQAISDKTLNTVRISPQARVMGALPPDFSRLYALLDEGFSRFETGLTLVDISSFQCFTLMNGLTSALPKRWQPFLQLIQALSREHIELLTSMTRYQLEQFLCLDQDSFMILSLLRSLRKSSSQWRQLVVEMCSLDVGHQHLSEDLEALRQRWQRDYRIDIALIEELYQLLAGKRWELVYQLDDEIIRLIDRGELNLGLFMTLKHWQDQHIAQSQVLFKKEWDLLTAFLDDQEQIQLIKGERSFVDFRLNELFPSTMSTLEGDMQIHLESFLVEDVSTCLDEACAHAHAVRQALFRANHMQT